jgi:cyclohexyl-isocyanide hydratase
VNVGIFVFDGADELDVVGPQRVFAAVNDVRGIAEAPPVRVLLVAEHDRTVRLTHGLVVTPDATFGDCPLLDVLVVPGGGSTSEVAGRRVQQRNATAIAFLTARAKDARVVASVCTGAFLLAETGALAGRKANTHWMYRDELTALMRERGEAVEIVPERVVWDGDVVTGGGVTSGIDIAYSIVERLAGARVREAIEAALERETPAG